MVQLRLGILLDDDSALRHAHAGDPVDVVILRACFLNQPRAAGARSLAARVREIHPAAELVPYAWHYLTHEASDGAMGRGTRTLAGDPGGFGHLRSSPEVERAWTAIVAGADAMDTSRVLLYTPPSFSPGTLSRRRLRAFVTSRPAYRFVWQPSGLWSTAEALGVAGELAMEVLDTSLERGGRPDPACAGAWLQVVGGRDGLLRDAHAEILADGLAERLEDDPRAVPCVIFAGPKAHANLRTFSKEWARVVGGASL